MTSFNKNKLILPLIAIIAIIGFAFLQLKARQFKGGDAKATTQAQKDCKGRAFAEIGGDFNLVNQDNKPVSNKDFLGRPVMIYFGYTMCPDICPMSLSTMGAALEDVKAKDEKLAQDVQPILITLDPKRDTPENLKKYVSSGGFPKKLIGLSGTEEQIKKAASAFKVGYRINQDGDKPDDSYTVDHTSIIYLLGRNGKLATFFTDSVDPSEISQCIISLNKAGL